MASSLCDLPDIAHTANMFIGERLGEDWKGNRLIDNKPARFVCEFLSLDGHAPVRADRAILQVSKAICEVTETYSIVFVPAFMFSTSDELLQKLDMFAPLYPWLRTQWQRGAVIASVWTGTSLLAEAGLLDKRAAAIPDGLKELFRQRYPDIEIDTSREITEQDRIYCASMLGLCTRLSLLLMSQFIPSDISNLLNKSVFSNGLHDVLPPRVLMPGAAEFALDVNDKLVSQTQYWFQKKISEKVTLADAANDMLVSEKTLARHFQKALGITPHTYLQRIRMDSAKNMLLHSDLSIEIIAERVGYRDQSFFERVFRRHAGLTPSKYRKSLGRAP